ncbi:MAG: 1,4-dihydroxy-2-naphthoate octaprenyltransferase [Ignavibacteria bacterium]|nr:1,4-dihydroxy-2-naphthoate octaprenyltransferase [Ignavibacteria bacterium]
MMTVRAFAFPASVIPILYGSILSVLLVPDVKFDFLLFALTLIGAMAVHVGSNVINDIYDYKKGIDKEDPEIGIPHGGSLVLSKGFKSMRDMKIIAAGSLILAVLIGLFLYYMCGIWILYLMGFGFFAAVYYTANPFALKYKALGDLMVFLSFGVGMTLGAYYVQVKEFSWVPMLLSVPIGMLIIAILHSNNIRDMKFDRTFGVKTIPILIGESASKYVYDVLILGAYALIILFVVFGLLPWPALLNLVTLPAALKLIKMLKDIPEETLPRWEMGTKHNIMTAQFNMQFGLMLNIGLLLAWFFLSR